MDNMEAFDLEFDDDEYFLDFENDKHAMNRPAAGTGPRQEAVAGKVAKQGSEKMTENKVNDIAGANNSFKHEKLTLNNLHHESLKEAEKTKSSTPITKSHSKNVSAAHSHGKGGANELHEVNGSSSAIKDHNVGSRYHEHRRNISGGASPDASFSSPNIERGLRHHGGRLLGKRENQDREQQQCDDHTRIGGGEQLLAKKSQINSPSQNVKFHDINRSNSQSDDEKDGGQGRRGPNWKRKRSDEGIGEKVNTTEKLQKEAKPHNFGPLKQDPLAYQNALNSQLNQQGFQRVAEQKTQISSLQNLHQLQQMQHLQKLQENIVRYNEQVQSQGQSTPGGTLGTQQLQPEQVGQPLAACNPAQLLRARMVKMHQEQAQSQLLLLQQVLERSAKASAQQSQTPGPVGDTNASAAGNAVPLSAEQKLGVQLKIQQLKAQLSLIENVSQQAATQLPQQPSASPRVDSAQPVQKPKAASFASVQGPASTGNGPQQSAQPVKIAEAKKSHSEVVFQKNGPSPRLNSQLKMQSSYQSNASAGTPAHIQMPKLTAAQIENRRFSIYIKNLAIQPPDNTRAQLSVCKEIREFINGQLAKYGAITHISVDAMKRTAIIRFKEVHSAETAYRSSREIDNETGRRRSILGALHPESQVVYVIPEVSTEDLKVMEAAQRNEAYNPCKDPSLTLEQIAKFINDQNEEIKSNFKKFCQAKTGTPEKKQLEQELKKAKERLNEFLHKEKQIKTEFAIKKQAEKRARMQSQYSSMSNSNAHELSSRQQQSAGQKNSLSG